MNDTTNHTIVPPRSKRLEDETVFTERLVMMHGKDYYMRLFHSGNSEFARYDAVTKKWIFLCFPAA